MRKAIAWQEICDDKRLQSQITQQQAADTIASLKAGEQEPRDPAASAYWYSDLAALHFGVVSPPRPGIGVPGPRRSATARPDFRNARKRDGAGPLSLEAPQ